MAVYGGPDIVTDGLVLLLDAGNSKSYPGNGNTWFDLSGNNRNFTIGAQSTWNNNKYFSVTGGNTSFGFVGPSSNGMGMINNQHTIISFIDITAGFGSTFFGIAGSAGGITLAFPFGGNVYYDVGGCCAATQRLSSNTLASTIINLETFCATWRCGTDTTPNREFLINNVSSLNSGSNSTASVSWNVSDNCGLCYNWAGRVYNFLMYNRALSNSELLQNYNALKGRFGL